MSCPEEQTLPLPLPRAGLGQVTGNAEPWFCCKVRGFISKGPTSSKVQRFSNSFGNFFFKVSASSEIQVIKPMEINCKFLSLTVRGSESAPLSSAGGLVGSSAVLLKATVPHGPVFMALNRPKMARGKPECSDRDFLVGKMFKKGKKARKRNKRQMLGRKKKSSLYSQAI